MKKKEKRPLAKNFLQVPNWTWSVRGPSNCIKADNSLSSFFIESFTSQVDIWGFLSCRLWDYFYRGTLNLLQRREIDFSRPRSHRYVFGSAAARTGDTSLQVFLYVTFCVSIRNCSTFLASVCRDYDSIFHGKIERAHTRCTF